MPSSATALKVPSKQSRHEWEDEIASPSPHSEEPNDELYKMLFSTLC